MLWIWIWYIRTYTGLNLPSVEIASAIQLHPHSRTFVGVCLVLLKSGVVAKQTDKLCRSAPAPAVKVIQRGS